MSDELNLIDTNVRIYAGFERSISINYNTWKFNKGESRSVTADKVGNETAKLHWMCARYVYSAMFAALPRIRRVVGERPDIVAQMDLVEWEVKDALTEVDVQLEKLRGTVA